MLWPIDELLPALIRICVLWEERRFSFFWFKLCQRHNVSFFWSLSDLTTFWSCHSWGGSGEVAAFWFCSLLIVEETASFLVAHLCDVDCRIVSGSPAWSLFLQPFPLAFFFFPALVNSEGARFLLALEPAYHSWTACLLTCFIWERNKL